MHKIRALLTPFEQHNLFFTPAGIWYTDKDGNKQAKDANRYDIQATKDTMDGIWAKNPNDNKGRIKLPNGIVVLDIDKAKTTMNEEATELEIPALDMTVPLGLFSQTRHIGSYHIYYRITEAEQEWAGSTMIKGLNDLKIDVLQNYVCFEGHSYSPNNYIHAGEIPDIPQSLLDVMAEYRAENPEHSQSAGALGLHSNIQRYNLIVDFLRKDKLKVSAMNSLVKSVTPKEFHKLLGKNKKFSQLKLDYDLINKIAVKLTTTKELDHYEHSLPTLHKILTIMGVDPESKRSQVRLRQIECGLPIHESIMEYKIDDDNKTFQDLVALQPLTDFPIFRTIVGGKKRFVRINKFSLEPVKHNGEVYLEQAAAQILNTERQQYSEDGKPTVWDEADLPIVEVIEDPYEDAYTVDDLSRHCINIAHRSRFIAAAEPCNEPKQNILLRVMQSTIHPEYLDLMLHYHAAVCFGRSAPIMIPWCATSEMVLGGTGKSMVTSTILSEILGPLVAQVDLKKMSGGFDMSAGVKLLTLEDSETDSMREWNASYAVIKRMTTNAHVKINPKFGTHKTAKMNITLTGSSNSIPRLHASDRRFLCLEPAHIDGPTEPLTKSEAAEISRFERANSGEFDDVLQEYVNYLCKLHSDGPSDTITTGLYQTAPHTVYRDKWVGAGVNNVKSLILNLPNPEELLASIHEDRVALEWFDAVRHLIFMYNEHEGKVALSWEWFKIVIPLVVNDQDNAADLSKRNVQRMLGDITLNPGAMWAQTRQKTSDIGDHWALAMYTFKIEPEAVQGYIDYLNVTSVTNMREVE